MYLCILACIYMYVYVNIYFCIYTCMYLFIHVVMYVFMCFSGLSNSNCISHAFPPKNRSPVWIFFIRYPTAILFVINQLTVQRFYVSYFNPCSAVLTVLSQKLQLKRSLGVAIVYLHKEKFILTFCMILDSLISLFDLIGQSSFVFDTVLIETKVNFTKIILNFVLLLWSPRDL